MKLEPSFATFNPRDYLKEYYSKIGLENYSLLKFFARAYKNFNRRVTILELGGGPTVYQLISAAEVAAEIHFADYLDSNLDEVRKWVRGDKDAFDWRPFIKEALIQEERDSVNQNKIVEREKIIKQKITKFLHCDVFNSNPMGSAYKKFYDVVSVNFVAESITAHYGKWKEAMQNIVSTLKKGGVLIITALIGAEFYLVGNKRFPAVPITEKDIRRVLKELKFAKDPELVVTIPAETDERDPTGYQGYKGLISIKARY